MRVSLMSLDVDLILRQLLNTGTQTGSPESRLERGAFFESRESSKSTRKFM